MNLLRIQRIIHVQWKVSDQFMNFINKTMRHYDIIALRGTSKIRSLFFLISLNSKSTLNKLSIVSIRSFILITEIVNKNYFCVSIFNIMIVIRRFKAID